MSLDLSRLTFNPWNDYADVVSEQGRPQTDADWNEWGAELSRRQRAGTLDTLGHAVYPATTPNAFKIAVVNSDLRIGLGRMYVDGILVENHGPLDKNTPWDPALAELSNTPQPQPSTPQPLDAKNSILFTKQPYDPGATVPTSAGEYVAFLDVWQRPITYIEHTSLIDVAIGIDTSGRIQTAWRVTLQPLPTANTINGKVSKGSFLPGEQVLQQTSHASATLIGGVPSAGPMVVGAVTGSPDSTGSNINWVGQTSGAEFTPTAAPASVVWGCDTLGDALPAAASSGRLSTQLYPSTPSGPCCLTTGSGYTGPENQFYRVEIHTPGGASGANATIKWSRENASVQTKVTAIAQAKNSQGTTTNSLTVQSLGRDQVLGFAAGDWIEITDTTHDDNCRPGELYKIDSVDVPTTSIILTTPLSANFSASTLTQNAYTRIIRWDQSGEVYKISGGTLEPYYNLDAPSSSDPNVPNGCGGIPVPSDGSEIVLENGVAISFGLAIKNGNFQAMDYWNFTARTANGSIETLKDSPPRGIAHHYAALSLVTVESSGTTTASDCRTGWPPTASAGECGCCCSVTVGKGAKYSKIQEAVDALAAHGGEICVLAGTYYEEVVIQGKRGITIRGCGERTIVSSPSLQPGGAGGGSGSGGSVTLSGLPAVFTIIGSEDIAIEALCIHAGKGEVSVLMDRPSSNVASKLTFTRDRGIRLADLALTASTLPAIAARDVTGLVVCGSRVVMAAVTSLYPAVYLAGDQIRFERNDVRIESDDATIVRATNQSDEDEKAYVKIDVGVDQGSLQKVNPGANVNANPSANPSASSTRVERKLPIGGVQVGGPSCDVWIVENQIEGGSRNGITLGNIIYLDANGNDTGTIVGVIDQPEDQCCTTATGSIPGTTGSGSTQKTLAAGGLIKNLAILRNKICKTGMYGIGPVGFFDLNSRKEIISLVNVLIAQNILVDTLTRELALAAKGASPYGYGAIGLPDVQTLIVRDNIITDYGYSPGAEVCGIYVYHGEGIDIGRNQIRESRDLRAPVVAWGSYGGERAGIYIELATPPTLDTSSGSVWIKAMDAISKTEESDAFRDSVPSYAPGCSALRIVNNNVRVAYGLALYASGSGPFAILANHLSTGGIVSTDSEDIVDYKVDDDDPKLSALDTPTGALTVAILNYGIALETVAILSFAEMSDTVGRARTLSNMNTLSVTGGTVQFANNTCQLMAQLSRVHGYCSVGILTLDNLLFTDNVLWVNAKRETVAFDAALIGWSVQAVSNRLQEAFNAVLFSGYSLGLANVTAHNISTYCFLSLGAAGWWIPLPNVVLDFAGCPVFGSYNATLERIGTQ